MARMKQKKTLVAVALLSMCVGIVGCMNTTTEPIMLNGPQGYSQTRPGMYPMQQAGALMPPQIINGTNGQIRQAQFGQVAPGQTDDVIIEHGNAMAAQPGMMMPPAGP